MAVATTVEGDHPMIAVLASSNMAAKRRGAATLDGAHHLELAEADMAGISKKPPAQEAIVSMDQRPSIRLGSKWTTQWGRFRSTDHQWGS